MTKLTELFHDRFDSIEENEEGNKYGLVCSECGTVIELPSPLDAIGPENVENYDYANEIIRLIERVLEHLDQCQAKSE
jgi:Fe2+ or Zn2+ uptake regulation protein